MPADPQVSTRSRLPKLLNDDKYEGFKPISEFPDRGEPEGVKFGTNLAGANPLGVLNFRLPFRKPLHSVTVTRAQDGSGELIVNESLLFAPNKVFSRVLYEGKDFEAASRIAKHAEQEAASNPDTELYSERGQSAGLGPDYLRQQVIELMRSENPALDSDIKSSLRKQPLGGKDQSDRNREYRRRVFEIADRYLKRQGYTSGD